jgi:transcriptional regulator GlxA family with amidase domain
MDSIVANCGWIALQGSMTYNQRKLLKELDVLVSNTPRVRLSEIAQSLGVDRHTIENAMRATRNTSFREYKRRELLQKAMAMLNQPDVSVKEVGVKLGYSSAASFSRFVQQSTGKSPSQLRKDGL